MKVIYPLSIKKYALSFFLVSFLFIIGCSSNFPKLIVKRNQIYAWCIVPFDSVKRSPIERINMLKKLGINKYAYDWREEHLTSTANELTLAKKNNIEIIAVWMWIDNDWDQVGKLNAVNEKLFQIIKQENYSGQIWVSFNANFFSNLSDSKSVEKGVKMIEYISKRVKNLGCKVGLYNHGDWFGAPKNQLKIIQKLPDQNLGIVYNFHHAHQQIDQFSEIIESIMPYLWCVNLNGMRKEGPKILTIGEGNYEFKMIQLLKEKGYKGDFGILGHVENADVEVILKANLKGLEK